MIGVCAYCALIATARAEDSTQCLDLVKECFVYKDAARDTCFHSVATHTFCRDTETSQLAKRRAQFSALVPNDADSGPSLIGPQLVDRTCVSNFDNAWMSSLVRGAPSREAYNSLRNSLESCSRAPASDMMRP